MVRDAAGRLTIFYTTSTGFGFMRLLSTGSLDTTFGDNGVVFYEPEPGDYVGGPRHLVQ